MAQRRFSKQSSLSIVACDPETQDGEDTSSSSTSSFDSLPNDVAAEILLRLPARFLHNSARHVCRTWSEISQHSFFTKSHLLLHSKHDLLIQDAHKVQSINAKDLEIRETDLNSKFPGKIIRGSTSDGVLLIINKPGGIGNDSVIMELYVANPVTMQVLKLPTLPSTCRLSTHCNNIAKIPSTGETKVVSLGKDAKDGMYNWYVLTIGKEMSWRKIGIISTSDVAAECDPASYLSYVQSLSVNGVVYWTNSSWINDRSVLAINLGSETAQRLKVPGKCQGQYWTLVQMGREICCMNGGKGVVEMKVWKLKDLARNEWVMVKSVTFSDEILLRKHFCVPLIWLDLEVLVLSVYVEASNVVVAYHVNKGECKVMKVDDVGRYAIFQHTSSLIRF